MDACKRQTGAVTDDGAAQVPARTSWGRRLAQRLGVVYREGGEPRPGGPARSRYDRGLQVSPRLDQDVDELRARLEAIEARLRD